MNQKFLSSAVALLVCSTAFAAVSRRNEPPPQPECVVYQGDILTNNCVPAAYNAPARIDLRDRCGKYGITAFFDASFIYWYATQDGMDLAHSADLETSSLVIFNKGSVSLTQPFTYDPGFKVGLGLGFCDWEIHSEYTWVRQSSSLSKNAPTNNTLGGTNTPVWEIEDWFSQAAGSGGGALSATHLNSKWRLSIDLLDVTAGRPYYEGKNLTVSPFGGVRAAWIRQSLTMHATVPAAAVVGGLSPQPVYSNTRSQSWGVGPTFGASAHCLVGAGFRVEGDAGASLLFTRYTKLTHSEGSAAAASTPSVFRITEKDYNTVRPMANLGLGIGWGEYICCGAYHIDFSATYDFNAFWDQNMMRTLVARFGTENSYTNDLFLHGLTVTARFDF